MERPNYMVDELQKIVKKYRADLSSAVVEDVPRNIKNVNESKNFIEDLKG